MKQAADSDEADTDNDDSDKDNDSDDSDVADTCQVCDKPVTSDADTVQCTSRCNEVFHRTCVNQSAAAESFECSECVAGRYRYSLLNAEFFINVHLCSSSSYDWINVVQAQQRFRTTSQSQCDACCQCQKVRL